MFWTRARSVVPKPVGVTALPTKECNISTTEVKTSHPYQNESNTTRYEIIGLEFGVDQRH